MKFFNNVSEKEESLDCLKQNNHFLNKTYGRYLLPTMLSTLGATINVLFDGIIVGQKLGSNGLAAVNLCMPLFLMMCTIGSLIVSGGSILSSRAIGEGKMNRSARIYNTVVLYVLAVSLLVTIIGLVSIRPLVSVLSGNGELYQMVFDYVVIIIAGTLPKIYLYVPLFYLRLDGLSKWNSVITLSMTIANIVFDIVFVHVFEWGTGGAALASVLATVLACGIGLFALGKTQHFHFKREFEPFSVITKIIKNGSPHALYNLMCSIKVFVLNSLLLAAGGSAMVSIFSVVNNVSEFSLYIVEGVPLTAAPLIGIYSMERNNQGIKILMKRQFWVGLINSLFFGILISIFANQIGGFFGVDFEMYGPVICLAVSIPFACANHAMAGYYNNVDKVGLSNLVTILRNFVMPVLVLEVLINMERYIWLFIPLGEVFTGIILLNVLWLRVGKNPDESFLLLLDEGPEKAGKVLDFSVEAQKQAICDASEKIGDFCSMNNMSPKLTMRVGLAIEEMLTLMTEKCFDGRKNETFDLRVFVEKDEIGIRIRCLGRSFNPLKKCDESEEKVNDEWLGIRMIREMANNIDYQSVFGANSLLVRIVRQ